MFDDSSGNGRLNTSQSVRLDQLVRRLGGDPDRAVLSELNRVLNGYELDETKESSHSMTESPGLSPSEKTDSDWVQALGQYMGSIIQAEP